MSITKAAAQGRDDGREVVDPPNLFELLGPCVYIHYATSGIDGVAHLTFRSHGLEKSFKGDEIRLSFMELGQLVSVTLSEVTAERMAFFSFILPAFDLPAGTIEAKFQAAGIATTKLTPILAPGGSENGPLAAYDAIDLQGIAKVVAF